MDEYIVNREDTIREFDCRIYSVEFFNKGSFFTVFPISPRTYREKSNRKFPDKVLVTVGENFTDFTITDDWNSECKVSIHNSHKKDIEYAISKAKEYRLL